MRHLKTTYFSQPYKIKTERHSMVVYDAHIRYMYRIRHQSNTLIRLF